MAKSGTSSIKRMRVFTGRRCRCDRLGRRGTGNGGRRADTAARRESSLKAGLQLLTLAHNSLIERRSQATVDATMRQVQQRHSEEYGDRYRNTHERDGDGGEVEERSEQDADCHAPHDLRDNFYGPETALGIGVEPERA